MFVLGLLVAFLAAGPAFADPSVGAKQAEARQIMAQLQEMDGRLGQAIEAYNLASTRLDGLRGELRTNTHRLKVAKSNLRYAQRSLSHRVVSLYKAEAEINSTLAVILGASSLDELLARLDTVSRVSNHDTRVMRQVRIFRHDVRRTQLRLKKAESAQRQLVAERAARKTSIESQLAERQRLLSSVKNEIAQLQAQERARQAALVRQAQSRAAAQQTQAAANVLGSGDEVTQEPEPEVAAIRAPDSRYTGVVAIAMQYIGVPYLWGGASPSGFDCSGFIMYVYAKLGVSLPHNAAMQYGVGVPVSRSELQPGDLVFFNGLGHNGMYIGGDQFIHAPHSGDFVKISSLNDSWYARTWVGARRVT